VYVFKLLNSIVLCYFPRVPNLQYSLSTDEVETKTLNKWKIVLFIGVAVTM